MEVTLPRTAVQAVLDAETSAQRDVAIEGLRRAYFVATAGDDDTDEWADADPSELLRG